MATPTPTDIERYRENLQGEVDAAMLYRTLADLDQDAARGAIYRQLAEAEERHGRLWAGLIRDAGEDPGEPRPGRRPRIIAWIARKLGVRAVLPIINLAEARDVDMYSGQPEAGRLPVEERSHARVFATLARTGATSVDIAGIEGWHKGGGAGGPLRAAIFGINDGLVSNLSLVMGVAGADVGARFILLAGVAGLLAGAFSMAAGEWVSMKAQREVFERQIEVERKELEISPDEERDELSLIYQAKGVPRELAEAMAGQIIADPAHALDTLAREELGLDPGALGSPVAAGLSSFLAFGIGAVVPVLPYLFGGGGTSAIAVSGLLSGAALFAVGAVISFLTGRGALYSGIRMLLIGAAASVVTFLIGRAIGVQTT